MVTNYALYMQFYETVEKCLLVAHCVKQLDPSSTTNQDQPSVLGLTPQHAMELMPTEKVSYRNTVRLHT